VSLKAYTERIVSACAVLLSKNFLKLAIYWQIASAILVSLVWGVCRFARRVLLDLYLRFILKQINEAAAVYRHAYDACGHVAIVDDAV